MAKAETIKDKKIKSLLLNLSTQDPKKQLSAIKSLKIHGDETIIKPMAQLLMTSKDETVIKEITDLLNTIKSTKVPKQVAECLMDEKLYSIHQVLLASVWNSGLDYTNYLKEIVQATVKGDMMFGIECITIIENIDGDMTEDNIFEPLLILREYLVANKDVNDPKIDLLKEITLTLQKINDNL